MSQIYVEASEVIDARPEAIYAVLSDYHVGHPSIVPKPYFTEVKVEKGGQGAGSEILVRMEVWGVKKTFRMVVTEPEPGRVLMEADPEIGLVTTFTVDPIKGSQQSRVTIATTSQTSPGIGGWIEKLVNPSVTRHIYKKELQQLADYVRRVN